MKICYLADAAAVHIQRWAAFFAGRGHEVHILTLNPNALDGYQQMVLHFVRTRPKRAATPFSRLFNFIPFLARIRKILRGVHPDVLHAHSAGGYAWLGMLSGFHPFVITPWGSDVLLDAQSSRLERFFTRVALQSSDLITCDGKNTIEAMVQLGISLQKIRFLTFGVDVEKFKPDPERRGTTQKTVISTRTLTSVHDVETFVRSAALVLEQCAGTKFVIVGSGPLREKLEELAEELGVDGSVHFLGQVSEPEMAASLQQADVYVSTSLSESGLAASTAEAMACGLPVINTDTGDIRLWIRDGRGGFIVPSRSPQALAQKTIELLQNAKLREFSGRLNRKVILLRNNYQREMGSMERIYADLAGGASRAR